MYNYQKEKKILLNKLFKPTSKENIWIEIRLKISGKKCKMSPLYTLTTMLSKKLPQTLCNPSQISNYVLS